MSLVATTSLTCESVTREGSGFRGVRGTRGKPSIGVLNATYTGETYEDLGPSDGVMVERGDGQSWWPSSGPIPFISFSSLHLFLKDRGKGRARGR
jgi:hypothetical protein